MAQQQAFEQWWATQGDWVEEPNERRGGHSGVQFLPGDPALYLKRQTGHIYRTARHPMGRPTVLRELDAYHSFAQLGIPVPRVVFGGARKHQGKWQAILVTEALTGYISLYEWYERNLFKSHPNTTIKALQAFGHTLAVLHKARWRHGCCYTKHLFLRQTGDSDVQVALIDLEKSKRFWRADKASERDLSQLYRRRGAMPDHHWPIFKQAYDDNYWPT